MSFRQRIYRALVNKQPGISNRYHKFRRNKKALSRVISWLYLLWLNFAYYVLFCKSLGRIPEMAAYEEKRLNTKRSESEEYLLRHPELSVEAYVEKLKNYDVISFDLFDTLIFRPLDQAADVFYLVGEQLGVLDFRNIRVMAEYEAREKCNAEYGHREVNLEEIWRNLQEISGIPAEEGMALEQETEQKLCYANPFMLAVWGRLAEMKKTVILVSDMYLPSECIVRILDNAGYRGFRKLYLSNEYRKSKADGGLYGEVVKDWCGVDMGDRPVKPGKNLSRKRKSLRPNSNGLSIIHIGDNPQSDMKMARRYGLDILPYRNVNQKALSYRPMDMSYLTGSAYRGVVSGHLYNGLAAYSMEYEYGYIYGGLFVLGYCHFIHDYAQKNGVDKVLFLSRDGDILKQVYGRLYPADNAAYVYWSRKAAVKLMAGEDKHDFFRRFIEHKVNRKYTIKEILHAMELDFLAEGLVGGQIGEQPGGQSGGQTGEQPGGRTGGQSGEQSEGQTGGQPEGQSVHSGQAAGLRSTTGYGDKFLALAAGDELTDRNSALLREYIETRWNEVIAHYAVQQEAAGMYYQEVLAGCRKAVAVDVGWAGSGALALAHLAEKVWKIPCEIVGLIAGTNTIFNAEPDAAEPFLQSGKLAAYLYSQGHNRDLLKKHDPNKGYNVFWELLLSSPTPQFTGFATDGQGGVKLNFAEPDANTDGVREIQRGIMDFVLQYHERFRNFPFMYAIGGRDAYAPMLVAASGHEKYLKEIEKRFAVEININ